METSDGFVLESLTLFDTSKYLKSKNKTEYFYSVITALATFFICGKQILWYPVAFIIFDILGIIITFIANLIHKIKFNRMSLEDKKNYLIYEKNELNNWYPDSNIINNLRYEAREKISNLISEIEEELKRQKQEAEDNPKTENKEIASYFQVFNEYKKKITVIRDETNKEFLKEINSQLKEIINLVSEKPSTSVFTNKLFNLYIPELIILLNNFPKSDETEKEEYKNNVIEVLTEIDTLIENTKKTIVSYNQRNAEISFDVLKREIKKAGEELDADD